MHILRMVLRVLSAVVLSTITATVLVCLYLYGGLVIFLIFVIFAVFLAIFVYRYGKK